jgi:CheY-like chemotaxis protein/serine phosphatase RsbU (regulator of sigma subunit)
MPDQKNNADLNKLKSELSQRDIFLTISSLSDFIFILNPEGYYIDVRFPDTHHTIDLDPKLIVNKHYKKCNISNDFERKLEKYLTKLKETSINQQFEFTVSENHDFYYFSARISELKSEKNEILGYVVLAHNITKIKNKEITLANELEKQIKKVEEAEREANFYIKQGDVITNQRSKIEKQRDKLAIEKDEMAKQKELMETDLNFIMKQGDKIAEQKHKIKKQHDLVRTQNKKIEDSILYAKRIQSAVLPPNRFIQYLLSDHFIFYKPRDIVSGDFYWIKQVEEKIFIAAADCTGHGVPGALMSMLGITFLNEIINKDPNIHANEVLNELRTHIISSLRQTGSSGESRDGMDVALCIVDHKNKMLEFAGANNPLYMIRDGELMHEKGCKMPIGIHRRAKESFVNHYINIKQDDLFYIFSDGYVDQFGGEYGRKFLSANFKKLLLEIADKPLLEQRQIIEKEFDDWKGERKQLDDILVIGFRISFEKVNNRSNDSYNWEGKTILVAEDDDANFLLLQKALERTNAEIIHAENGKEAVNMVKLNPDIDLVLMDIRMPIMDGIEATSQIKMFRSDLPIVVQTAFTMSSEKEKSFKAGCDDYISKPINIKELYATVSKYLE